MPVFSDDINIFESYCKKVPPSDNNADRAEDRKDTENFLNRLC